MVTQYQIGGAVLCLFIIIILIACLYDTMYKLKLCKKSEKFTINHPMVFKNNVKIAPGNCKPYSGCFFPSNLSNTTNPKTGERYKTTKKDEIWCEESWRDCNAYQTCINGKCVSKV